MKEKRSKDDNIWIERVKANPDAALKDLYKLLQGEFQQWLGDHYGLKAEEARDVFQETMLSFYENVRHGKLTQLDSSIKTYLFAIGKYKAISFLRKYRKEEKLDMESYQIQSDKKAAGNFLNGSDQDGEERVDMIRELLSKLKDPCQSIILGFYFHKKTMVEIAQQLNYNSPDVAKAQKYRCMSKFIGFVKKKS